MQLQRYAGSRETTHYRANWNLHHVGGFLVAEPVDGHEQQRRSLIGGQAIDRAPDLVEGKACFDAAHRLVRTQPFLDNITILFAHLARADLVDPDRLHDAKHPTVEPSTLLKLMLACELTFAGSLNEIVGI